jgi:hypothetical protein
MKSYIERKTVPKAKPVPVPLIHTRKKPRVDYKKLHLGKWISKILVSISSHSFISSLLHYTLCQAVSRAPCGVCFLQPQAPHSSWVRPVHSAQFKSPIRPSSFSLSSSSSSPASASLDLRQSPSSTRIVPVAPRRQSPYPRVTQSRIVPACALTSIFNLSNNFKFIWPPFIFRQ